MVNHVLHIVCKYSVPVLHGIPHSLSEKGKKRSGKRDRIEKGEMYENRSMQMVCSHTSASLQKEYGKYYYEKENQWKEKEI